MTTDCDDQEFGRLIHQRLLEGDPVASADLCERWLAPLVQALARRFPDVAARDENLIDDAVADAVLDYAERPAGFDPQRSDLRTFLSLAARRDLLNALRGQRRRAQHEPRPLAVEDSTRSGNLHAESAAPGPGPEEIVLEREGWQAVWQRVEAHFPDARDRQLLRLVLQGERKTTRFAVVLGLADLDRVTQQREVKRHKDRIAKRLRRLGEEWGATDGQGGPDAG